MHTYVCIFIRKNSKIEWTPKIREKIRQSKLRNNNPNWKGDSVGYNALHEWIRNHKPQPSFCENCKSTKAHDLANISGEYKRDINDFKWLCRRCHMYSDGRILNLNQPYK